jgi:hypothetical protein
MLRRWRSRRRVAGIVIAALSVAAALRSAATLSAGGAAAGLLDRHFLGSYIKAKIM